MRSATVLLLACGVMYSWVGLYLGHTYIAWLGGLLVGSTAVALAATRRR